MNNPGTASALRPSKVHRWLRWLITLSWAGLIFYLSTAGFGASFTEWLLSQILSLVRLRVSPSTFELLHFLVRKLAHITEYSIFSLLLYASFQGLPEFEWNLRIALRSILVAGVYSLTDEFHQSFVANRTPSLVDCGIDTAGATVANLVVYGRERWLELIRSKTPAKDASAAET